MSYDLKRSHFSIVLEKQVSTGEVVTEEGVLLVSVLDATDGTERVQPSDGTSGEVPAGFAIRDNADNATTSAVEAGTVPASGTLEFQLANNNLVITSGGTPGDGSDAQLRVEMGNGDELTLADNTSSGPGVVGVDPDSGLLEFDGAEAGEDFTATYRYNLTVAEARLKFFQRNINNEAGTLFGQTGVGHGHGEVFTDQFDSTVLWDTAGQAVWSGPGGILVGSAGGSRLDARVVSVPNVNNPLLGIAFDIGGRGSV